MISNRRNSFTLIEPFDKLRASSRQSFTLIELLVVLALVAILSVVVVMTLNPAELLKQARDSNRLSDLATINTALNLFSTDVTSGFMGTSTVIYVSLPSTTSTCSNLGLPTLPTGYTYNCVTSQNLRNTDGTGWIPVNFNRISSNSPISQLPIDPQNTTSTKYYTYVTGGSWKVIAVPESQKYLATAGIDGGSNIGQFEVGNNMNLAPFTDGLVGWWKFDEGAGTSTVDSSGWGNNGTWNGTSTSRYVSGKVGPYAGYLNGGSDYVNVPNPANVSLDFGSSTNFTLSFWLRTSNIIVGAFIVDKRGTYGGVSDGYNLYCTNTMCELRVGDGSVLKTYSANMSVADGIWHCYGVVMNRVSGFAQIYADGAVVGSGDMSGLADITSLNQLIFGSKGLGGGNFYGGNMDDIRIYNRALSAAEILALYNATK